MQIRENNMMNKISHNQVIKNNINSIIHNMVMGMGSRQDSSNKEVIVVNLIERTHIRHKTHSNQHSILSTHPIIITTQTLTITISVVFSNPPSNSMST
jgi:hypothetical protein